MRRSLTRYAALVVLASMPTIAAADEPRFEEFQVTDIYEGPTRLPDFKGRDREFANFRTRIINGLKEGPNFAGHYSIVQIGCGTGCTMIFVADNRTGRVFALPKENEDGLAELKFRLESRLLIAQWSSYDRDECFIEFLEWDGSRATVISKKSLGKKKACWENALDNETAKPGSALVDPAPGPASATNDAIFPELSGRVIDQAGLLSEQDEQSLAVDLEVLENQTTDQLVVLTLPSLQNHTIEDYSLRLKNYWGIGTDKSILLIVVPNERKVRIEVGGGLQTTLTDRISRQIIDDSILPHFKDGNYAAGIKGGVNAIILALRGDAAEREGFVGSMNEPTASKRHGTRFDPPMVIKGRCHMGGCLFTQVLSMREVARNQIGTLLEVTARLGYVKAPLKNNEPQWDRVRVPKFEGSMMRGYAFCSTKLPAVISFTDNEHSYVVDVFTPGDKRSIFGYNTTSHLYYWAICHNRVVAEEDMWQEELGRYANALGYRKLPESKEGQFQFRTRSLWYDFFLLPPPHDEALDTQPLASSKALPAAPATRVGQCSNALVKNVTARFSAHEGEFGSEDGILELDNGLSLYLYKKLQIKGVYWNITAESESINLSAAKNMFRANDRVEVCLKHIPTDCDARKRLGDRRGEIYSIVNSRNKQTAFGHLGRNGCGGA